MEIIDIQLVAYNILKSIPDIKKVTVDYPAEWNDFPSAVYKTIRIPHFIDADKEELQSSWRIIIELYDNGTIGDLTPIALKIDSKLKAIGFFGKDQDANTGGLTRKVFEYSAIVDNQTKYVFQK